MEGIVAEEISNLAGTGKVSLGGNTWTARTESEGGIIRKRPWWKCSVWKASS